MILSVLSGKGGAGKTTISASLAWMLQYDFVDADVDAPDGALLLGPQDIVSRQFSQRIPAIDAERCTACGACVHNCQFQALYLLRSQVRLQPALCHDCGLCATVCPQDAISWDSLRLGQIHQGQIPGTAQRFSSGELDIGMARATPLIAATIDSARQQSHQLIVDGPPGVSCGAAAAARHADLALLVAEPTPFGLQDMQLVQEMLYAMDIDYRIIINKYQPGCESLVSRELAAHESRICARIPLEESWYRAGQAPGSLLARDIPAFARHLEPCCREVRTWNN